MSKRRPIIGGNWKMNTNAESAVALARGVADGCAGLSGVEVFVCPPFPYLTHVGSALNNAVMLAAQDLYHEPDGAFTGEISTAMLADCGVRAVLTGHSERRHVIGEGDALINKKTRAALNAGLLAVLCVGEKLDQRDAGETDAVNERQIRAGLAGVTPDQMARVVIAYEPVWAIGTGKTATPADAQDAHAKIRAVLTDLYGPEIAGATRIQYGGSVKASNAAELFGQPDIDGGLIGGASLKTADFLDIVRAAAG
ncbi:MAG: triose-phosphate isomerase [Phycisphaeraceae bacterium]|nr:MAG: triose-phosphate isomerase [Phycisphaeraceae bacterium]